MLASLAFPFHTDTLVNLGPLAIRWYGLAYVAGVVLGWLLMRRVVAAPVNSWLGDSVGEAHANLDLKALDTFFQAAVIGIILGGRLFYVGVYNWGYYSQNPWEILYIWRGGMSFHGGLLGVLAAIYFTARRHHIWFFALADIVAAVVPIGLFFGRLANFVNCELYGTPTNLPWGVVFNQGTCINPGLGLSPAGDLPRHPSQIYEALTEGLLLFVIMLVLLRLGARRRLGVLSGVFLLGYGVARISIETFRVPDPQFGALPLGMSMGQWLSLPMLAFGGFLLLRGMRQPGKA